MAKDDEKEPEKNGAEARKLSGWLRADRQRASDYVLSKIAEGRGHLAKVAALLNVSERSLDRIMKEHPTFAKVAGDMREANKSIEAARRAAKGAP